MNSNSHEETLVFRCGEFEFHHGLAFQDAREAAAREIMERYLAGDKDALNDSPFHFAADVEAEIDLLLLRHSLLAELAKEAPLASWVLARLIALSDERYDARQELRYDSGGWAFDYYVFANQVPVASLQFQGNMDGVLLLGTARDEATVDQIVDGLVSKLVTDINDVRECCYSVVDPEWEFEPEEFEPTPDAESVNYYGWETGRYLGGGNIREKS